MIWFLVGVVVGFLMKWLFEVTGIMGGSRKPAAFNAEEYWRNPDSRGTKTVTLGSEEAPPPPLAESASAAPTCEGFIPPAKPKRKPAKKKVSVRRKDTRKRR